MLQSHLNRNQIFYVKISLEFFLSQVDMKIMGPEPAKTLKVNV